jgi:hypothetical protein
VPASARRQEGYAAEKLLLHDQSRLLDYLTGKLTRYPYGPDQFYHDAMAGIRATRVIDLKPGKGEDPLCCSLRSIRFEDGCQYEALSYTWKTTSYERAHLLSGTVSLRMRSRVY